MEETIEFLRGKKLLAEDKESFKILQFLISISLFYLKELGHLKNIFFSTSNNSETQNHNFLSQLDHIFVFRL